MFESKELTTGIKTTWVKTDRGTYTCHVESEKLKENNIYNNSLK